MPQAGEDDVPGGARGEDASDLVLDELVELGNVGEFGTGAHEGVCLQVERECWVDREGENGGVCFGRWWGYGYLEEKELGELRK